MQQLIYNSLIISTLFLFSFSTNAQTEKKSWMIGGSLGANSSRNSANSYTLFNIYLQPKVGYFVAKNFVIGVEVPLSYGSQTYNTSQNITTTYKQYGISTIGISPFTRHYLGAKKLKPLLQAKYAYNYFSETTVPVSGNDVIHSGYSAYATLGVGLAYFVAPNVSIDATLDFQIYSSNATYDFNNQPNFRVGLQVYLPKK